MTNDTLSDSTTPTTLGDAAWQPLQLGRLELPHRLVMAPMTRSRANPKGVPSELNAAYYAQRAAMGLIISEGTQPSEDGQGYLFTPGLHSEEQVAGWQLVTDAVHAAGGHIFIQLMHTGRISHPDNTPHHRRPVAPSEVTPSGAMFTASGPQEMPTPRALSLNEIATTVEDFQRSARLAIAAGADGVEIHGANGYLLHQFLSDNANLRADAFGGSIEHRAQMTIDVAAAVADAIGPDRTGIRISPGNTFNDIVERDTEQLYAYLVAELAKLDLAYLHVMHFGDEPLLRTIRDLWPNALIVNRGGRPREQITRDLDDGLADLASLGTFALANPDLVQRLRGDTALNEADAATFYGGGERGYTDYPRIHTPAQT